jgi:mRNA interferase MazF
MTKKKESKKCGGGKDYERWNKVKIKLNDDLPRPMGCKPRDIWQASVGENTGFEEDGKGEKFVRPVLILRVYGNGMCHVIPLSTTKNRGVHYFEFDGHTGKKSVALLSQTRLIDGARLRRKAGYIEAKDFNSLKEKLKRLLNL